MTVLKKFDNVTGFYKSFIKKDNSLKLLLHCESITRSQVVKKNLLKLFNGTKERFLIPSRVASYQAQLLEKELSALGIAKKAQNLFYTNSDFVYISLADFKYRTISFKIKYHTLFLYNFIKKSRPINKLLFLKMFLALSQDLTSYGFSFFKYAHPISSALFVGFSPKIVSDISGDPLALDDEDEICTPEESIDLGYSRRQIYLYAYKFFELVRQHPRLFSCYASIKNIVKDFVTTKIERVLLPKGVEFKKLRKKTQFRIWVINHYRRKSINALLHSIDNSKFSRITKCNNKLMFLLKHTPSWCTNSYLQLMNNIHKILFNYSNKKEFDFLKFVNGYIGSRKRIFYNKRYQPLYEILEKKQYYSTKKEKDSSSWSFLDKIKNPFKKKTKEKKVEETPTALKKFTKFIIVIIKGIVQATVIYLSVTFLFDFMVSYVCTPNEVVTNTISIYASLSYAWNNMKARLSDLMLGSIAHCDNNIPNVPKVPRPLYPEESYWSSIKSTVSLNVQYTIEGFQFIFSGGKIKPAPRFYQCKPLLNYDGKSELQKNHPEFWFHPGPVEQMCLQRATRKDNFFLFPFVEKTRKPQRLAGEYYSFLGLDNGPKYDSKQEQENCRRLIIESEQQIRNHLVHLQTLERHPLGQRSSYTKGLEIIGIQSYNDLKKISDRTDLTYDEKTPFMVEIFSDVDYRVDRMKSIHHNILDDIDRSRRQLKNWVEINNKARMEFNLHNTICDKKGTRLTGKKYIREYNHNFMKNRNPYEFSNLVPRDNWDTVYNKKYSSWTKKVISTII